MALPIPPAAETPPAWQALQPKLLRRAQEQTRGRGEARFHSKGEHYSQSMSWGIEQNASQVCRQCMIPRLAALPFARVDSPKSALEISYRQVALRMFWR